MKKDELIKQIQEMLQTDAEIKENMKLEEIEEWDSLAVIGILSLYDELFSKSISADEIMACTTYGDLIGLVSNDLTS